MSIKGRIVEGGMGGFLNPPGHPEHDWHVETDLRRKPENRGCMSLSYAAMDETLDPATQIQVQNLLDQWGSDLPPLTAPTVVDWIHQVLGYYKSCYNFQGEESGWHVGCLTTDSDLDPLENTDFHAGVHCIRKFYPEYRPSRCDFLYAYWGSNPE